MNGLEVDRDSGSKNFPAPDTLGNQDFSVYLSTEESFWTLGIILPLQKYDPNGPWIYLIT